MTQILVWNMLTALMEQSKEELNSVQRHAEGIAVMELVPVTISQAKFARMAAVLETFHALAQQWVTFSIPATDTPHALGPRLAKLSTPAQVLSPVSWLLTTAPQKLPQYSIAAKKLIPVHILL